MKISKKRSIDYDDICLVPRVISDINSRDDIKLNTNFADFNITLPIIASPMKDVCDGNIAKEMRRLGGLGIIHRFNTIAEQVEEYKTCSESGCAIGINGDYLERFLELYMNGCKLFCIDIANGATAKLKSIIENLSTYSGVNLIVGNVASKECYEWLEKFDRVVGIRVGIAGGCFVRGTKVFTKNGKKNIESIKVGDEVLTHKGRFKKVIGTNQRLEKKRIFDINGIKCTGNHKFYVLKKEYKDVVNEDNLHEYAEWVSAEEMNEDYFLIKIQE